MSRANVRGIALVVATACVAFGTRIGPTILVLTPTRGVHVGDLIPAALFITQACVHRLAVQFGRR